MEEINKVKAALQKLYKKLEYVDRNLSNTYIRESLKNDLNICRNDFNNIIKVYFKLKCYDYDTVREWFDKVECLLMFVTNMLHPCDFLISDFII